LTGPQGPVGTIPEHQWSGSKLRVKLPDGSWGPFVDLTGPQGPIGPRGPGATFSINGTTLNITTVN
jgi:hypothetical protein